jgi:hypothetical protein
MLEMFSGDTSELVEEEAANTGFLFFFFFFLALF